MSLSVAANHVSCGVGVLDVGNAIHVVDAVPVVAVEEEGGLGAGVGESVGNLAKIDIGTCNVMIRRIIVRPGATLPSS